MSPGDLGQLLKPFVFLDHVDGDSAHMGPMPMHPHSGIATLTCLLEGDINYEDTTGRSGLLPAGGIEWMMAGNGVWHAGSPASRGSVRGFQLWIAMPPELENAAAHSLYLPARQLPRVGPARVLLGRHGGRESPIAPPASMNYLAVDLMAGETWHYRPPQGHTIAWLAVSRGRLDLGDAQHAGAGELVLFEESEQAIAIQADAPTQFVIGSACKHPHDLVLGRYSVHTSAQALLQGEAGIRGIATRRPASL
jgi:redox-sensitive bicupin YhaK (pirin superfamily)